MALKTYDDEINTGYVFYDYISSYVFIPLVIARSDVSTYDMRYMNNWKLYGEPGDARQRAPIRYAIYYD